MSLRCCYEHIMTSCCSCCCSKKRISCSLTTVASTTPESEKCCCWAKWWKRSKIKKIATTKSGDRQTRSDIKICSRQNNIAGLTVAIHGSHRIQRERESMIYDRRHYYYITSIFVWDKQSTHQTPLLCSSWARKRFTPRQSFLPIFFSKHTIATACAAAAYMIK